MKRCTYFLVFGISWSLCSSNLSLAYTPVTWGPNLVPGIGPGVISPDLVFGKEYSHDEDQDSVGVARPEQVIAWDGIGGVMDGINYSGSRGPNDPREQQVDALANHFDALYTSLFSPSTQTSVDRAHLVFSIDDTVGGYLGGVPNPANFAFPVPGVSIPTTGNVVLSNGNTIGGSGDISIEEAGFFAPPETQGIWTTAAMINNTAPPRDLDGLELWGPEPPVPLGDANKYSLDVDTVGGANISVWSYDIANHDSVPYIDHATIVMAVESLLGPITGSAFSVAGDEFFEGFTAINLDALMVFDLNGSTDSFDFNASPDGAPGAPPHDSIIFSIRQIYDSQDPTGYYATGSELFVLDASGFVDFLTHGGHVWDKAYALANLQIDNPDGHLAIIDINALEAIGEVVVPEPTSACLLMLSMTSAAFMRYRL